LVNTYFLTNYFQDNVLQNDSWGIVILNYLNYYFFYLYPYDEPEESQICCNHTFHKSDVISVVSSSTPSDSVHYLLTCQFCILSLSYLYLNRSLNSFSCSDPIISIYHK